MQEILLISYFTGFIFIMHRMISTFSEPKRIGEPYVLLFSLSMLAYANIGDFPSISLLFFSLNGLFFIVYTSNLIMKKIEKGRAIGLQENDKPSNPS